MKDDRRSRRTRRLVTTAMTDLLLEKPYDKITIQAILDRADIGRATFYHHFRDKLDVVDAVAAEMLVGVQDAHPASVPGGLPIVELFRHAAERYASLRAMLDTPGGEVFWKESQAAVTTALESMIAAGRPARPNIPAPVAAEFVSGAFLAVLRWWIRARMPYPPGQIAAMFEALMPPLPPPISRGPSPR